LARRRTCWPSNLSRGVVPVLDADEQRDRGDIIPALNVERGSGEPNQRHANSVALFEEAPSLILASGFVLSGDAWFHHSWCIKNTDKGKVTIETTPETYQQYFGLEYQGEGASELVENFRVWIGPRLKPGGEMDKLNRHLQGMEDASRTE
jgi:hypothetical protein